MESGEVKPNDVATAGEAVAARPYFVIWGDVETETILARPGQLGVERTNNDWLRFTVPGGVWIVSEIVQAALKLSSYDSDAKSHPVSDRVITYDTPVSSDLDIPESIIEFAEFPSFSKDDPDDHKSTRIRQTYSWTAPHTNSKKHSVQTMVTVLAAQLSAKLVDIRSKNPTAPMVSIINDLNRGFRTHIPVADIKHLAESRYIIWNLFEPLSDGNLWSEWHDKTEILDKIILIIDANALRRDRVNIRPDSSDERSLAELASHIAQPGNRLHELCKCGHLIIRADHATYHFGKSTKTLTKYTWTADRYVRGKHKKAREDFGKTAGYRQVLTAALACGIEWLISAEEKTSSDAEDKTKTDQVAAASASARNASHTRAISYGARLGIKLCELLALEGYSLNHFLHSQGQNNPSTSLTRVFDMWASYLGHNDNDPNRVQCRFAEFFDSCKLSQLELDLSDDPTTEESWRQKAQARFRYQDFWKLRKNSSPGLAATNAVDGYRNGPHKEDKLCFQGPDEVGVAIVRNGLKYAIKALTKHAFEWESHKHDITVPSWVPAVNYAIPVAEFGKIESIARDEIDAFSTIESLVIEYLDDEARRTPLCFAVFGAPGAGKSFTIQQILSNVLHSSVGPALRFNVAQFDSLEDLAVALHQVQDQVLERKQPPLVFFDEFDCRFEREHWGWLKYFLSPMQDGEFKDGNQVYRIGRAILVFAGGVFHKYQDFASDKGTQQGEFEAAKGPDFISRLRGHLDIAGVNHPNGDRIDEQILMRRAILLRHLITKRLPGVVKASGLADVEPEVVRAFLRVPEFCHGVRSMEALLEMSHQSRGRLTRASMPTASQLKMHVVNPLAFDDLMK